MSSILIHPQALCESANVGPRTRVWAFAHVLPNAQIGADCNICDHVFIENDVRLGDRVTVKCGVQLWDGLRIGNDVFIGPNATFTNDKFPRSKAYPAAFATTTIEDGASIGANATILPGVTIGRGAMVGAGTVLTKDAPARAIVLGNPGRIVGYAGTPKLEFPPTLPTAQLPQIGKPLLTSVRGVTLHRLKTVQDLRGSLSVGNFPEEVPFQPSRFFVVHDVPSKDVRGEHAHRECSQFLVCVNGSVAVIADDGTSRQEVLLDGPSLGLYLPPLVWGVQYKYTNQAVLLVFASHPYAPSDYIRDYSAFLAAIEP